MIQTFGKYQILEHVATGSVAEIYKARQEGIGGFQRTYAIKRILPELSQNADYIAMLVDEAKVAGLLTHANIVQIVDLGQVDDRWYIAMEYVHGKDLGAVLARARERGLTLPVPHTAFVAIELLKGLEYAHQRQVMRGGRPVALNIIHRDVSPANVLLSFQGEVKLTDFGLARASLKAMEGGGGSARGRYDYMSPEQVSAAKEIDQRTDLFSVGVLLYEMITGRHPFRQETDAATLEALRAGRYTPITRHNPDVPFSLETIVDRALQSNRDDRFSSATAFKEALDRFFHEQGFIFTHATLASYVRGLFGEGAQRNVSKTSESDAASETPPTVARPSAATSAAAAMPPVKPRKSPTVRRVDATRGSDSPDSVVNVEQDVELVSRNAGSRPPPEPEPAPKKRGAKSVHMTPLDGSLGRATPIAQLLDDVDHATVIRKGEPAASAVKGRKKTGSLSEDDMATRQLHPDRDLDGATVLRKASSAEDHVRPPESAESVVAEPAAKPVEAPATPGERRRGVGWLPLGAALFGMILGIGATVALTPVVTDFVGQLHRWGITVVPVPVERMPRIEVVAPRDAEILLDGEAVGKGMTVEPYVVHHLTVRPRGLEPWTRDLELGLDEVRVFVVSPVHAREKQGNPEATRQAAASPTPAE